MNSDPHVSAEMWLRIDEELRDIETAENVRIVLAVESGSRAWRFPSPDSDYDVRFIYLRPHDDYLTVTPMRDVIERPIDAVLDVNGWDLRKALGLMAGSNAVLQEWLTSPIRYRADDRLVSRLQELAVATADIDAYCYHYDRMARRHFEAIAETSTPRLKSYCYALRPILALKWLRLHGGLPPMDLPRLLDGIDLAARLRLAIADLVAAKAKAAERDVIARQPDFDAFIADALKERMTRPLQRPPQALAAVNRFFAETVLAQR
ncbi:MAG TPA: nucleotidyltransferase domain-containing protein [Terriglobales bacterium]|nr:nucleotidyltransferase domain-containing protein [Terriglobales bacterium]